MMSRKETRVRRRGSLDVFAPLSGLPDCDLLLLVLLLLLVSINCPFHIKDFFLSRFSFIWYLLHFW
jgi:hypothetical protein